MSVTLDSRAIGFGNRSDISARSVLVTIFGDSVVPTGGEIWLGDLIDLCEPFGFSDRLVRTSMFRLSSEGWFDTERVGRRSRYRLKPTATDEFAAAESRIYHRPDTQWDGRWTIAFVDTSLATKPDLEALRTSLGRHGYATLSDGVMAAPRHETAFVRRLAELAGVEPPIPVATATFDQLEGLVAQGWFAASFGLDDAGDRYRDFIARYRWTTTAALDALVEADAFVVRTMMMHDFRRPRLADPELPDDLLPADWPGSAAFDLAGTAYRATAAPAWRWLANVADLPLPDPEPGRFRSELAAASASENRE